ncbi:hypothetical protein SDC9_146445 [bioreactor metagenome]|uniref:Uncharacterized protein n=1 Tax=bioreactor metagenome TaxID=1076179 RepID=A0A645EB24_9ZZZZ
MLQVAFHRPADVSAVVGKTLAQIGSPFRHQRISFALVHLVGAHLVGQGHQQVPVHKSRVGLQQHEEGEFEAWILFHALQVEADDRDLRHLALLQRLAQQKQVVACPASATGLGDHQRNLVDIIAPMLDGIDELAYHQLCGIADIVVYISQPLTDDVRSLVFQQDHMVPMVCKHFLGNVEVHRAHVGDENRVLLFHLLGKWHTHFDSCEMAASKLRIRIFTAPRFTISSIFIWV